VWYRKRLAGVSRSKEEPRMDKQAATSTKTFREVNKIVLPSACLNKAYKQMRVAAMQRQEAVALFAGVEEDNIFHIIETIIPEQVRLPSPDGTSWVVPDQELVRICSWLEENECELIAQIHSDPRQACQAAQKEAWPIIHIIGGISIIVPDFALGPTSPETWSVYRLAGGNKWIELDKNEICHLFEITY
jgi:hypothetical protein